MTNIFFYWKPPGKTTNYHTKQQRPTANLKELLQLGFLEKGWQRQHGKKWSHGADLEWMGWHRKRVDWPVVTSILYLIELRKIFVRKLRATWTSLSDGIFCATISTIFILLKGVRGRRTHRRNLWTQWRPMDRNSSATLLSKTDWLKE